MAAERKTVFDIDGNPIDMEAARNLMDDGIAESLHGMVEDDQELIERYSALHRRKFGEDFAPYHGLPW